MIGMKADMIAPSICMYYISEAYRSTSSMFRYSLLYVVLLLCLSLPSKVIALSIEQDPFTLVSDVHHSGHMVYDLLQDEKGFIWIATDKGLLRYDGNVLSSAIQLDQGAVWLDRVSIHKLERDSNGRIWVVLQDRVAYWDWNTHTFQPVSFLDGLRVTDIVEQGKQKFWVSTEDGLYFYDASSTDDRAVEKLVFISERNDPRNRNFITALYLDKNGWLWMGTSEGACILDTQTRNITEITKPGDSLSMEYTVFIEEDVTGAMWIGTRENGLLRVLINESEGGEWGSEIDHFSSLPADRLLSVQKKPNGHFIMGTHAGLFGWDPVNTQVVDVFDSFVLEHMETLMPGERVLSLHVDQTGLVWLGTENGVYKSTYRPAFSTDRTYADSLGIKHIKSIVLDKHQGLWAGSFGEGVVHIDGQSGAVTRYKSKPDEPNSLVDDRVVAIDIDQTQHVWILTSGGISRLNPYTNTFKSYLASNDVSVFDENLIFQEIFVSQANEVWVTTSYFGVLKYDPVQDVFKRWDEPIPGYTDQSLYEIRHLIEDDEGNIWFAAGRDGLLKFDTAGQSIQTLEDILGEAAGALKGEEFVTLTQSSSGEIWAGSLQGGAFRIDPRSQTVTSLTRLDGLPGNEITCIKEDKKGFIWMVVRDGLARYDTQRNTVLKFDEHDGLRSTQFYYNSCLLAHDTLYLGNNVGAEEINLQTFDALERRPSVQLTSVQVMDHTLKNQAYISPIQLNKVNNFVRFQFFVPDYLDPSENQLLYKIPGLSPEWKVADVDNVVSLEDLQPGAYQLFVKGANHRGVWSDPQIYTIQVSSFSWFLWGGVGIGMMLLLAVGGLVYRARTKYVTRIRDLEADNMTLQDESEQSIQRTKSEIARDLHDDLGADLSRLVLSLENRLQREDLSDFSLTWTQECWEYAQRITREVRFLSWSVDPERNWLPDLVDRIYREAHESFDVDRIQFITSKIPNIHLAPKVRKDIFLIFREALTNIINHASARKIRIQVDYKKGMLVIILEDDGVGFDVDKIVEGNGLSNMKKRASDLRANLYWESQRGSGTKVVLQYVVQKT